MIDDKSVREGGDGRLKNAEERSLAEEWTELSKERSLEKIEFLYRYTDASEILRLFGSGPRVGAERLWSGLCNLQAWQVLNNAQVFRDERRELKGLAEGRESELPLPLDLFASGHSEVFSVVFRHFRPLLLEPTVRGFSANSPAEGYRNHVLISLRLGDRSLSVGDLPGDQKIMLFGPTYLSTPAILVNDLSWRTLQKADDPLMIDMYGDILPSKLYGWLSKAIENRWSSPEELLRSLKEVTEPIFLKRVLPSVLMYLEVESRAFLNKDERDLFFEKVWEEAFVFNNESQ